jgi:hypothetical protein
VFGVTASLINSGCAREDDGTQDNENEDKLKKQEKRTKEQLS